VAADTASALRKRLARVTYATKDTLLIKAMQQDTYL